MREIDDTRPQLMFVDDEGWYPERDVGAPYVPWPGRAKYALPIIYEPTINHRVDQIDHRNLHPARGELPYGTLELLKPG